MIIYGRNSIEEALEEGLKLEEVVIERGKEIKFPGLSRQLREKGIKISTLPTPLMDKTAETRKHQGILARMILPPNIVEDEKDNPQDWSTFRTILTLDGITDTGNLGAIIRSALLFEADAVVLPNDNSARITPQAIKASAGAVFKQKVIYVNNLNTLIETLKADGFTVFGLTGDAQQMLQDTDPVGKVCLVIGSEREGIRKSVKRKCDFLLKIPTTRKIDSLNASVAAAVTLWEFYRKKL